MTAGYLLHHLLARQAARHPERPAIIDRERTLGYGALAGQSRAVARALRAAGAGPGTPVGLWMDKSSTACAALYGILESGRPTCPSTRSRLPDARSGSSRAAARATW